MSSCLLHEKKYTCIIKFVLALKQERIAYTRLDFPPISEHAKACKI